MTKAEYVVWGAIAVGIFGLLWILVLTLREVTAERRYLRRRQEVGWLPDHPGGPGRNQALDPDQEPGAK